MNLRYILNLAWLEDENVYIQNLFTPGRDFSLTWNYLAPLLKGQLQKAGFIRVREMSGKFKIFQGQGIVREFHNLSGKIEFLLKCQGNVGEF